MKKQILSLSCAILLVVCTHAQILVSPKALFRGPIDSVTLLMQDSLRVKNLVPPTEPYSSAPYNRAVLAETAGETVSPAVLSITGNNAIVDWVFIELRSAANSATVVATKRALIQRDGDVVSAVDGVSPVPFATVVPGDYYVSINHRNHLGVMTATPISISAIATVVDFTTTGLYVKPGVTTNLPAQNMGGKQVLWAGDARSNKNVKYNGLSNDKDAIYLQLGGNGNLFLVIDSVYKAEDTNMDGKISFNGLNNDRILILNQVGPNPNLIVNTHLP